MEITVMSFGYKEGAPPTANMVFDVRFLRNPYWVEELRSLSGMDAPVQDYVMNQPAAVQFLDSVIDLLKRLLPKLADLEVEDFTIAFGCTGGQHRSATMCERLAQELSKAFPQYKIVRRHREISAQPAPIVALPSNNQVMAED